jgi:predicted permease
MVDATSVFVGAVLPVISIAAAGYLLRTLRPIDAEPLNAVTLYVFLPALAAHSLLSSDLGGDLPRLVAGILIFSILTFVVALAVGRGIGESGSRLSALVFVAALPNVGNFGIPVATFAFGPVGGTVAVVFTVTQGVLNYTAGVYVAAWGTDADWRSRVGEVLRLPLVYVVVFAAVLRALGLVPPAGGTTMGTLELVGNASIPTFLLVLGIQLAETEASAAVRETVPALGLRFLLAPAVGFAVALLAGFGDPAVGRTFVLLTAAPAAVTPLVLLVEFAGDTDRPPTPPEYYGTAVFLSTLLSMPVATGMILLLQSGVVL